MHSRVLRICVTVLAVVVLGLGVAQLQAKKPQPPVCPTPGIGCFCADYYAPVICTEGKRNSPVCEYSNICFAMCSGWSVEQCAFTITPPPPIPI